MAERSKFIRGLLDPIEEVTEDSLEATTRIGDFNIVVLNS